jgi:hypothetical protein
MITLFSIPKPMDGEFARLQANAVGSWRALGAEVEILLLGDEPGVAECARRFGVRQIPRIARTGMGTPRVDDIFAQAERGARSDLLAYVNADILLGADFPAAARAAADRRGRFLMVGRRWDLDFADAIDFANPGWAEEIRALVRARGILHEASGIDYFVFRRGSWPDIPAFAVGRTMWDNWLIWKARVSGMAVIDATACVTAVHQNHGYNHHPQGWQGVWKGPEAETNEQLAGGLRHYFTIDDATHEMAPDGTIRRWTDAAHRRRWWTALPEVWKPAAAVSAVWHGAGRAVMALRMRVARLRGRVK